MTPKVGGSQEGRLLLSQMPQLFKRHLSLGLLRHLDKSQDNQSRMSTALRAIAFESPIGRKVKALISSYDSMGCGEAAEESVLSHLLGRLVQEGYIVEQEGLIPSTYSPTAKGSRQLERRGQIGSALLAGIVASRQLKKNLSLNVQEAEDLLESAYVRVL